MIPCLFRMITHYPCPACGMTRAMCSLLVLDIQKYFYYNVFALPVAVSALCLFIHKFKKINFIFYSILILNLIYYFFRLQSNSIP